MHQVTFAAGTNSPVFQALARFIPHEGFDLNPAGPKSRKQRQQKEMLSPAFSAPGDILEVLWNVENF
jgi:hypothetical protein